MVKSYGVVGGLLDYIVSFLGQVIAIVISRPRSLTIRLSITAEVGFFLGQHRNLNKGI